MNLIPKSASSRVIVNTAAQYSRSLLSIFISLYTTRLILQALGVEDYGIYSLVAGVVAMLAFINSAIVATTQRFLSYHQGKSDLNYLKKLWGNIVVIYIGFSILIVGTLEALEPFLFGGFLNIQPDRIATAEIVYQCSVFMVTLSFFSASFQTLLVSHENIVYSTIVQLIDTFLRLGVAITITYIGSEKLILYSFLLCGISIFDLLAYSIYTSRKYEECVRPRFVHIEAKILKSIGAFFVWSVYSTACIVGRTQGCAIVLNRFYGAVINTAFGIAQQVSGAISFVSNSLLNALNPQIVKAEGAGNREKMLSLTMTGCKFGFFLLSIVVLPLVAYMPVIIKLWLGETPEYVVLFCRVILISGLCDQITLAFNTASNAIGKIRAYSVVINTIKFSTTFILALLLFLKVNVTLAIWIYAIMELVCASIRIPFLKHLAGLKVKTYFNHVILPLIMPLLLAVGIYWFLPKFIHGIPLIVGSILCISILYILGFYFVSLSKSEKEIADRILIKIHLKK